MNVHPAKSSVLLVSQANPLIIGQLNSSSPWDETSYRKDCGHRYSLSRCSLQEQKNSGSWNGFVLVRNLILSVES